MINAGRIYTMSLVAFSLSLSAVAGLWLIEKRVDWILISIAFGTLAWVFEAKARWNRSRAES
jgi:hypothetical protein